MLEPSFILGLHLDLANKPRKENGHRWPADFKKDLSSLEFYFI